MTKRTKKLKSAIEAYKKEIENHFDKLDNDIRNDDEILARYHCKEIDRSLIAALEHKVSLLGKEGEKGLLKKYRDRLQEYKKRLGID